MKRLVTAALACLLACSLVAPALAADVKVSQLPAASRLDGSEKVPIVQGSTTKQAAARDIAALAGYEGPGEIVRSYWGVGYSGTSVAIGFPESNQGSAVGTSFATTNRLTRAARFGRQSASTAGSEAASRTSTSILSRDHGFTFEFRGGLEVAVATQRLFFGLRASATLPGNIEPSAQTNIVGIGADAADTNLQLMHNDGSGTATKVDTGIAKAAGDVLVVELDCTASLCTVTLDQFAGANLTTTPTATYTTTVSTDMPASSTLLSTLAWACNGTTAASTTLAIIRQLIRTPY